MSEQPKLPKKPQRNKAKKLVLNERKSWQDIVNGVEKKEVPIEVLQHINVQLLDGTNITINIRELIAEGQDPAEIEALLDEKFNALDQYIKNVDFFVDIDRVVNQIQPETERLLRNL